MRVAIEQGSTGSAPEIALETRPIPPAVFEMHTGGTMVASGVYEVPIGAPVIMSKTPKDVACAYLQLLEPLWDDAEVFYSPVWRQPNLAEIAVVGASWDPVKERSAFEAEWHLLDALPRGLRVDVDVRFRGDNLEAPIGFEPVTLADCRG
jgi:hypothetical protein